MTGNDLASATNPENGTVSYTYDGAHTVAVVAHSSQQTCNFEQTTIADHLHNELVLTKKRALRPFY